MLSNGHLARFAWLLCLLIPLSLHGQDRPDVPNRKPLGKRYRLKVRSVGIPGHSHPIRHRTRYTVSEVFRTTGQEVASAYLNEYVYLERPGDYRVTVGGHTQVFRFVVPEKMSRKACEVRWNRGQAVDLEPQGRGPIILSAIWLSHHEAVRGPHSDEYAVFRTEKREESTKTSWTNKQVATGVTVMYGPEGLSPVDDGIAYADTMVHLWPGEYVISLNGTNMPLTLGEEEFKHIEVGALFVRSPRVTFQLAKEVKGGSGWAQMFETDKMLPVCPGKYRIDDWLVVDVTPGSLRAIRSPGRRPVRLGLRGKMKGGVFVVSGLEDGPARTAGLQKGDRVLEVDGKTVTSPSVIAALLKAKSPGDTMTVLLEREGEKKKLTITLERKAE